MAKYNEQIVTDICNLIKKDSYTIAELCKEVGIASSTYYEWLETKAEFSEAIQKAKYQFDEIIVNEAKNSLRKLVQGYEIDEKKTVFTEGKDGKPRIKEQTTVKKHIQPNVAAIIFLLTNKASNEFKNRLNTDHTTKGMSFRKPNIIFGDDDEIEDEEVNE